MRENVQIADEVWLRYFDDKLHICIGEDRKEYSHNHPVYPTHAIVLKPVDKSIEECVQVWKTAESVIDENLAADISQVYEDIYILTCNSEDYPLIKLVSFYVFGCLPISLNVNVLDDLRLRLDHFRDAQRIIVNQNQNSRFSREYPYRYFSIFARTLTEFYMSPDIILGFLTEGYLSLYKSRHRGCKTPNIYDMHSMLCKEIADFKSLGDEEVCIECILQELSRNNIESIEAVIQDEKYQDLLLHLAYKIRCRTFHLSYSSKCSDYDPDHLVPYIWLGIELYIYYMYNFLFGLCKYFGKNTLELETRALRRGLV